MSQPAPCNSQVPNTRLAKLLSPLAAAAGGDDDDDDEDGEEEGGVEALSPVCSSSIEAKTAVARSWELNTPTTTACCPRAKLHTKLPALIMLLTAPDASGGLPGEPTTEITPELTIPSTHPVARKESTPQAVEGDHA